MPPRGTTKAPVSPVKARKMLRDGEVGGRPMTSRQRRFFGRIAGGAKTVRKNARKARRGR